MTISNIILDFDGTLTDIYAEARDLEIEWQRLFAERTGLREDALSTLVSNMMQKIAADPAKGWGREGQIVVSATADPLIMTMVAYREILDDLRQGRTQMAHHPLPATTEETDQFFECLYDAVYQAKKSTTFQPRAKEFLGTLLDAYDTIIVTNSDQTKVSAKIAELGDRFGKKEKTIEIIGDARKHVNNPKFDLVSASMRIDGCCRDILLRREHYYDILTMLMNSGFYPHNTAIVGDIFELDLAMPSQRGYYTIQIETQGTQPHERLYHQRHPRSAMVPDLDGVLDMLGIRK